MKALTRWCTGRTPLFALLALAGIFALVGVLANQSRVVADDGGDRVLRPMGPENQLLWADDSPVRLSGGGGDGGGKEAVTRDGGGGAGDSERKPARPECSGEPTGRWPQAPEGADDISEGPAVSLRMAEEWRSRDGR